MTTIKILSQVTIASAMFVSSMTVASDKNKASSFYVFAKLGSATTDVDHQKIIERFNQSNTDAQLISLDDSDIGDALGLGYHFTDWFSVELGYTDLGKRSVEYSAAPLSNTFYDDIAQVYPNSANGLSVAIHMEWEFVKDFSLSANIGAFHWQSDFDTKNGSASVGKYSSKGDDVWYGTEINYQLTDNWQVFLMAQRYHLAQDNVDLLGLGARYYFGGNKPKISQHRKH